MRDQTRKLIAGCTPSALWLSGALGIVLFALVLTDLSAQFGYDWAVVDMPIATLAALLTCAGLIFFAATVAAQSIFSDQPAAHPKFALPLMIVAGLIARLVLFASEPALEDDYQRYLWDGAVTAHGVNPYIYAPQDAIDGGPDHPLAEIAKTAGVTLDRINHKSLTTIYPPVAQAALALAHMLKPFSLVSWRSVLLIADVATLAFLLAFLNLLNRSHLWSALYWWNPMVLKEFFNSAHMDALILPLVLATLYLAVKKKPVAATTTLGFAIGTKIWPILLVPLVWRHAIQNSRQLALCVLVATGLCLAWLVPYSAATFGENTGTFAYAQRWTINSPLFTTVRSGLQALFALWSDPNTAAMWGSITARGLMAGCVSAVALLMARTRATDATDFLKRALIIVAALVLLAPAIYPWYALWMAPLLALVPQLGLLLLFATIPLYYTYFYFAAREVTYLYQNGIVWLVWVPVWLWCALAWWSNRSTWRGINPSAPRATL